MTKTEMIEALNHFHENRDEFRKAVSDAVHYKTGYPLDAKEFDAYVGSIKKI